tara:strand:- start:5946 stop:6161 length:216 start_codon:yes stop_codon:yes gene_type:complete
MEPSKLNRYDEKNMYQYGGGGRGKRINTDDSEDMHKTNKVLMKEYRILKKKYTDLEIKYRELKKSTEQNNS